MDPGNANSVNYWRLYIRLFYLVKGARHDLINCNSIFPAHDPSGIIKNIKVNRTREHSRVYFLCPYGPASAARIRAICLYHARTKNAIHGRQGPATRSSCSYAGGALCYKKLACLYKASRVSTRAFYVL